MNSDNLESERILETLKRTEARFLTFAENTSDILWETDAAGAYSFSSPNVSAILGYEAQEMLGKTPFDFMPPEEAVRVAEKLAEYISEGKPFVIEHEICSRSGEIRSMECSGVPIIDGDKGLTGYRGIDRDITERKKLERQLRVAQKMEAIGNLAGGIAHDFNNILSVISGYCDLLSSKSSPAEIDLGIEAMKKASKRAASLTQQLLALARRQVMQPTDFDLDTLIEDLAQMLRRMIGEHIEFDHLIAGERCVVKADPSQVEQVIINLVLNARDAMPNGGKLKLETRHVFEDGRSTRMSQVIREGHYAALVVRDAGTGMTREVQARIFEPFFTTKTTGSGMGLATVYGIVKQSGGYIWADSEPESGSTFTIYLPAAAGVTKTEPRAPSPDKADRCGKALLVEDQEEVRLIARKMLESIGFDVIEASNGDDGLRLAVEHEDSIDILLTDVVMPGMSGLQLADALKERNQETKIILMSGCIQVAAGAGEFPQNALPFLRKPFSIDDLKTAIHQVLDS